MTISAMGSNGAELSHGTLVLLLPTRDGIVSCADKRRWNETTGPSDDAQKIFQLAPQIAFAISGHHEIVVPSADKRLSVLYSLSSSVQSFYSSHPSASHPDWKQLKATLKEEFEAAYLKHNVKTALSPAATDDVVWEIEFLYLKNGHPAIEGVRYHIDGAVEADDMPRRPYITGETEVVRRILKPREYRDARFADLWNNATIARVWNFTAIDILAT